MEQAATQPDQAETGISESDAAAQLLERWKGRQEADPGPSDDADDEPAQEDDDTDDEQPEGQASEKDEADEDSDWEIEFGGQTRKLPKGLPEEVVREVQEFGQNLHKDYTKKTQEIAEVRKQAEAERASASEMMRMTHEHADLVSDLRFVQRQIESISQTDLSALSESDPLAAQKQMVQLMQLQNAQQRIGAQLQTTMGDMQAKRTASANESLERATAELSKEIKGWGPQTQQAIRQYGQSIGFSDSELSQVTDARLVRLLHKAQQYDALQTGKEKLVQKVVAPKTLKPNAAGTTQSVNRASAEKSMRRLSRTGSVADAAAALMARSRSR